MVVESWHREWPGKSLNAVAQFGNASHSLWVLNKEVLEVLELPWRRQQRRQVESFFFFLASFVLSPLFQTAYCTFVVLVVVHSFKHWFKKWRGKKVRHIFLPSKSATLWCVSLYTVDLPVFFLTSKAILKPSSINSTTCTKSASLNCLEVRAGAPGTKHNVQLEIQRKD